LVSVAVSVDYLQLATCNCYLESLAVKILRHIIG
jgi:hypothetical protein